MLWRTEYEEQVFLRFVMTNEFVMLLGLCIVGRYYVCKLCSCHLNILSFLCILRYESHGLVVAKWEDIVQ